MTPILATEKSDVVIIVPAWGKVEHHDIHLVGESLEVKRIDALKAISDTLDDPESTEHITPAEYALIAKIHRRANRHFHE